VNDDRTLLTRAQALDKSAIAQIHDGYYAAIYGYISFRVDDPQTVEDLTSEVFIRFVQALQRRRGPDEHLGGWLYKVAANVVKEHYRAQRRQRLDHLDESLPGRGPGPEHDVSHRLATEELRRAVADLSVEQQEVLALRFGYGMRHKEVAQTMGKSEGAVRMLQTRAIATLSELLSGIELFS
jgi:RNA polymerase sigma-70 factor (ECF subfamily)